jgi:2-keto-4-pentenoate hydratase
VLCSPNPSGTGLDGVTSVSLTQLDAFLATAQADGHQLVGYKMALFERESQQRLGADGPVWGLLTDDMAVDDGAECDLSTVASAKVGSSSCSS